MEAVIALAFLLDLVAGDPRWLCHPVRMIGWIAARVEIWTRKIFGSGFGAGIASAILVIGLTGGAAGLLLALAFRIHPVAYSAVSLLLIYSTIACRDLVAHSNRVYQDLEREDVDAARADVALMVGRDTQNLDEEQVARAAVESVAESTVDGVTAPLFFALLAGPVGALVYKAINTLDSTFGYKNERYRKFGWMSARIDDVANYIPARLTGPLMCLAAVILRLRCGGAWRVLVSDSGKHTSPNAGHAEAAMAGALGVQLGGTSHYSGEPSEKPLIGKPIEPLRKEHIKIANRLMVLTSGLFLVLGLLVRYALIRFFNDGGVAI